MGNTLSTEIKHKKSLSMVVGYGLLATLIVVGNSAAVQADAQPTSNNQVSSSEKKPSLFSRFFKRNTKPQPQRRHRNALRHTSRNAGGRTATPNSQTQHAHFESESTATNSDSTPQIQPTAGQQPTAQTSAQQNNQRPTHQYVQRRSTTNAHAATKQTSAKVTRENQFTQQFAQAQQQQKNSPQKRQGGNLLKKLFGFGRTQQAEQPQPAMAQQQNQQPMQAQPMQAQPVQPRQPQTPHQPRMNQQKARQLQLQPTQQPQQVNIAPKQQLPDVSPNVVAPNYYPTKPSTTPQQIAENKQPATEKKTAQLIQTATQKPAIPISTVPQAPAPTVFKPSERVQVVEMFEAPFDIDAKSKSVASPKAPLAPKPAVKTASAAETKKNVDTPFTGLTLDSSSKNDAIKPSPSAEATTKEAPETNWTAESKTPQSTPDNQTEVAVDSKPTVTTKPTATAETAKSSTQVVKEAPESKSVAATEESQEKQPAHVPAQLVEKAQLVKTAEPKQLVAPTPRTPPTVISVENKSDELLAKVKARESEPGFKGFCPVSLRDDRNLTDSKVAYHSTYKMVTYHFSSSKAKTTFDKSPERYAPVAGGSDVVMLRDKNDLVAGSLEHAVWYKGKLYMFSSEESTNAFLNSPNIYVKE